MIGIVTTSYPRWEGDSAGVFVRERVRMLVAEGRTVDIIAAKPANRAHGDAANLLRIPAGGLFYEGGAPEAFESGDWATRWRAWTWGATFSLALAQQVLARSRSWQGVESHWLLPCGVLVAALLPTLPHRAHVHGGDLFLLSRLPFADSLARSLCQRRPTLVFASTSLRDRFTALAGHAPEHFGARCLVEAAPFDRMLFRPRSDDDTRGLRERHGLRSPTVLAAGRLVPIKGFDELVLAIGRLPATRRPTLLIAGEGPERARLLRLARAGGVSLRLPGQMSQSALADHMAAVDLFVHPCRTLDSGRSEGMPLVVREALACGTPTVAFASGGLRDLRDEAGLVLVDEDQRDRLSQVIADALASVSLAPRRGAS